MYFKTLCFPSLILKLPARWWRTNHSHSVDLSVEDFGDYLGGKIGGAKWLQSLYSGPGLTRHRAAGVQRETEAGTLGRG
jgi:hypothetical protein